MNYGEEQRYELEALSEIYLNEIKVISKEPPISFSIKVRPQASSYDENEQSQENNDDENDDGGENDSENDDDGDDTDDDQDSIDAEVDQQSRGFCIELRFDLPEKYPDEKPSIQILDSQNLDEDELSKLMDDLNQKAEESLGTVMVFMLVSDVIEWLITKTEQNVVELEQEKENKLKEVEAEEQKRFEGTPVTESTFVAWKAKFDSEMLKAKFEQRKQQQAEQGGLKRLTGRAMFESDKTLAESDLNFVEDLDQNQIEALLHNIEELDVDEDEFDSEMEDEVDIDTDDDDDEEFELEDDDSDEEAEQNVKSKQKTKAT